MPSLRAIAGWGMRRRVVVLALLLLLLVAAAAAIPIGRGEGHRRTEAREWGTSA